MAVAMLAMVLAAPSVVGAQSVLPPWRVDPVTPPQRADIVVGETTLDVQLATTPSLQQLGLGYRNGLDEGTGMLFVFSEAGDRTFWMKGMRFCLDIVWIEGGEIQGAAENVCPDPEGTSDGDRARFSSPVPVTYVLEVPGGWLAANGYGTGTTVELPES